MTQKQKCVGEEAMKERGAECAAKQDDVLRELATVAFGDASDESGAKVKMTSKLRALELLGKHLGIFEKETEEQPTAVIVDDLGGKGD